MNYKLEGAGETIVFVHGLSDSLLYWEILAANLKNDYQVLRVDLRGHGETPLGDEEISIGLFSDDLKSLLEELGIEKINLVGFSLGGAIGLDFTIRYPQYVSSLVLMSTFFKADDNTRNIFNGFTSKLSRSFEDFYDYILPMVLCPHVIEDNRSELELLKQMASKTANTQAYINVAEACMYFNVENDLSQITCPTLVLAGKYDDIFDISSQNDLKNRIDNAELIIFDDVKHNLLIGKNNEKILKVLKNFLKNKDK